jgi:hypothetical protein
VIDGTTPRQTLGSYHLEEELGSGSTGVVWRARRTGPVSQVVALKRLRPGVDEREVARLRDEAQVLAPGDSVTVTISIEQPLQILGIGGLAQVAMTGQGTARTVRGVEEAET